MGWIESGTVTKTAFDYGPAGTQYSSLWVETQLDLYTSGDWIYYKLWIRCSSGYPHCYIYLNVNSTCIFDGYYHYNTFAYGTGWTYKDGWIWIGSGTSIPVWHGINTSQNSKVINHSFNVTRSSYTDGSAPSLSVTDNGNNTVTISGTNGKSGTNNGITSATLYWTTNGQWPNSSYSWTSSQNVVSPGGGNSFSKVLNISADTDVRAIVWNTFTYSSSLSSGNKQVTAKYYTNPGNPGKPTISYTKSRLTIKENWTFSWGAASAGNYNSPVRGYRIRLYKNGALVPIKDYTNGRTLSSYSGGDYWYDRETTSCSIIIDPVKQGFLPGDNIQLGVYAYAKNGAGDWLWSGGATNQITSDIYTVQNAGVMRPFYNGSYVEGQVFAKVTNTGNDSVDWVEADIVKTCVSPNNWVEAE